MIVSAVASTPPTSPLFLRPCGLSSLPALCRSAKKWNKLQGRIGDRVRGRRGTGICRAEFAQDAPFAAAIGACMLASLVFPVPPGGEDGDEDGGGGGGAIDSTDARFAVMGIIGFIPYFNWMSWVFAWLDSGRQRYLVYSVVYLVPYFRTNLSISPEESWLPIASIVLCILHIQLEASIRNGDINGIPFFGENLNPFSASGRQGLSKKERRKKQEGLPSAQDTRRENFQDWGVPRKSAGDPQHMNENLDKNTENKSD